MLPPRLDTETIWPIGGVILGSRSVLAANVPLAGAAGYVVPARFEVDFDDPRMDYDVHLEVAMDEKRGPRCVALVVSARPDGPEVSQLGLRHLPVASLLEQAARFMAYEQVQLEDGTEGLRPAKLDMESRARVTEAWRFARAAPRRAVVFPANRKNLKKVGELVTLALRVAEQERRRPTVYADVRTFLLADGIDVSHATVQRRIEAAQRTNFAPRWAEKKGTEQ